MSDILLINPSYSATSYGSAKGAISNPIYPTLGLTTIAGEALRRGHRVHILDLSYRPYDWRYIRSEIQRIKPDIVGITATTPLMNQMRDISVLCKDISKDILVVGGGAHISGMPVESMEESLLDLALAGESDITFGEICDGHDPKNILGVYYRNNDGKPKYSGDRPLIHDLDSLAMPAWHLYDPEEYRSKVSRILVRRPPGTIAEFSRGCVFKCDFCASKMTMALGYRKKSPERCAEEIRHIKSLGWREFMLADDIFTSDHNWATQVSEAIIRSDVSMTWTCNNGIRVESADDELFRALRRAGCYRVSFGFESGNDAVLKEFGKGGKATLEQGRVAVRKARAAGIDTNGFFLMGLSSDTEQSLADTIAYARSLELDTMVFGIAIAFPGTKMFNDYLNEGLIRSFNWDEYHGRTSAQLFSHRRLAHGDIQSHIELAHREAIFANPAFILRRLKRGFRTGEFFWDVYYGLKFIAAPSVEGKARYDYYAEDRWPKFDYQKAPLKPREYQVVRHMPSRPVELSQ
ncbi:MAG: B12-binding domain-containing radical SAM protein [Sulfuritalea sp.]|nr:B12-binding domain-containing radical SAM protein [Sulfuritalea sp.]